MVVYPDIESWNKFYPSEIFILLGDNETTEDALPALKIANIGTTIYLGVSATETYISKKIKDIEDLLDINSSMINIGHVNSARPKPPTS